MFRIVSKRLLCSTSSARSVINEQSIRNKLQEACQASHLVVKDTSGGCGSFFNIYIVSSLFQGLPLVKQHRMVKQALKDEVSSIHGLSITTKTPLSHEQDSKTSE